MHDFIDYYYHGPAPMIGYDQQTGWIDVEQMQRGTVFAPVPFNSIPAPDGTIYVFYRKDTVAWATLFPSNPILVYDPVITSWRPYAAK